MANKKGYRGKKRVLHILGSRAVEPEHYTPRPDSFPVHLDGLVYEFPVRPLLSEGSASVPNIVLTDPALPIEARMTYALLTVYAREGGGEIVCDMPAWKLAQLLDRSERYAHDTLEELKRRGYITSKRMGYDKPNRYTLLAHRLPPRTVATFTHRG